MFVASEVRVDLNFDAARDRLVDLIRGDTLLAASEGAFDDGAGRLAEVGPLGSVPGASRLVEVKFREPLARGDSVVMALRWQATGPAGGLFPALDADITLSPAGQDATVVRLDGAYRPPLGALGARLDRAILHRVATATIRSFLDRLGKAIADPAPVTGPARGARDTEPSCLPPDTAVS